MTRYLIGLETNFKEVITPNLAAAIVDVLGPGGTTMLWFNGASVYEADCDWNWTHVDQNIRALIGAGLSAPWLKLCGIPTLGTIEGQPTYDKYTRGVQRWLRDANGNPIPGSAAIDEALYYFKNPARPDPTWIRECARRLTDRYFVQPILRGATPVISAALCENEFDDGTYFPPVKAWAPDYRKAFELAWSNVVVPFAGGVRWAQFESSAFAATNAAPLPLIGPETAYDGLHDMLTLEAGSHLYTHPSFHGYCETKPETLAGALETLDKRMGMLVPFRHGRDVVIGEMGDAGGGWLIDYLEMAPKRHEAIVAIVTHGWSPFITCLNPNDPEESRQYIRNETGARLRALIERDNEQLRRRAVMAQGASV